ncbi:hypothetical protein V6N11_059514 [Hibiscus sabdariffa]|uniref:Uncharacterized protein n=2 Tax=Hibiscus sabdariffa TaxID=183260 RepID=A0ABR2F8X1_9ROSI
MDKSCGRSFGSRWFLNEPFASLMTILGYIGHGDEKAHGPGSPILTSPVIIGSLYVHVYDQCGCFRCFGAMDKVPSDAMLLAFGGVGKLLEDK